MFFSLRSIFTISIALCTTSTLFAERMDVEVLEDSGNSITLQYDFPNYRMNDILVNGKNFKPKDKVSGDEIVWIVNYRMSDQFKVQDTTKEILKIADGALVGTSLMTDSKITYEHAAKLAEVVFG